MNYGETHTPQGICEGAASVSYTHLDVYKRQRQECVEKAQNILKEAGLPEAMTYYGDENS